MTDDKFIIFLYGKIVAICEAILAEEIGIIAGSRKLAALKHQLSEELDEDFCFFVAVDSETDHLPVDKERRNWSIEALARKDKEIYEYESDARKEVSAVCEKMIQRFKINRIHS